MRSVVIQNEIEALGFREYNPAIDDTHTAPDIFMDRFMFAVLAAIKATKEGITAPLHLDPNRLDNGKRRNGRPNSNMRLSAFRTAPQWMLDLVMC